MIKRFVILTISYLLILSSCSNEDKDISTYLVTYKNFENIITLDGLAEPIQSINMVCPRGGGGGNVAFLIEEGTHVEAGDVVCIIENKNMENWYDERCTNLENSRAGLEKTKANLNMQYALLEAQVKNNEAQTKIAHLDSLQLRYYSPNQRRIKEMELKQVAIEKIKLTKKLDALTFIQKSEVRKLELEIQRTENQVKSTKDQLDALTLKAPKKGLATRAMNPMTNKKFEVGDVCWNNMPLVSIPEMEKMKVKIMAPESDYRYINVNDSVSYTFDATPNNIAWGKITNKMPVGQEYKQGSRVKFFEIEASIDTVQIMPEPGFTANCNIVLKEVKDTITIPQICIFEQDSMKVVYVAQKNGYEMRQILTAESSPKESVVTKGLTINEVITLRKPKNSTIKGRKILSDTIK